MTDKLSSIAEYVVTQKEAGIELKQIDAALQRQGLGDDDIDAAFTEAIEYFEREGVRNHRHADTLEAVRKAARAPGAKTLAEGLRQRARTGDKEAIAWLEKLGLSR